MNGTGRGSGKWEFPRGRAQELLGSWERKRREIPFEGTRDTCSQKHDSILFPCLEACQSGRMGRTRNAVSRKRLRRFESSRFRKNQPE